MSAFATATVGASTGTEQVCDCRLERVQALADPDLLAGEWDADRSLLIPRPGSALTGRAACRVPGCPHARRNRGGELCRAHREQFEQAGSDSLEVWLTAGQAATLRSRTVEELCAVTGPSGQQCALLAIDARGLCRSHGPMLTAWQRAGVTFNEFVAKATPHRGFGDCLAACCYLPATYRRSQLCETHQRLWRRHARPTGVEGERWLARAPQPATDRVLSLRGLPELVRLEVLYAIRQRIRAQTATTPLDMKWFVDCLRAAEVASVLDFDAGRIDEQPNAVKRGFARFVLDRVALAYADPATECDKDYWDLRVFQRRGHIDFRGITQRWLREGTKRWAAASMTGARSPATIGTRVQYLAVLSQVLASGPGSGDDPAALGRKDIDRFLSRLPVLPSRYTGRCHGRDQLVGIIKACGLILREAREMGLLTDLNPTFAFRRGDVRVPPRPERSRAIPPHVVAQLDRDLDLLRSVPGTRGVRRGIAEHVGESAVVVYKILKGTGRRVGEVVSLRLDCLARDEHGRAVLVYDNHKAGRMRRQLPLADTDLVDAIVAQQQRVAACYPRTDRERLWLFPRVSMNGDGTAHIDPGLPATWIRAWLARIPQLDSGPFDDASGEPAPFDRSVVTPHAFRHTYTQTLADEGVAPSVLRDLMDHRGMNTTLGYYQVGEAKKREAMQLLARHTIDNGGSIRPHDGPSSRAARLREHLSWVAVPMGKCSEPTNVRAGGQACPIRYQCAGCPHFESDPSYLPELGSYADDLRRERETLLAVNAADWVVDNVERQLGVIVDHIRTHEASLEHLADSERAAIEEASRTVRKARQSVPVAFGRRARQIDDG